MRVRGFIAMVVKNLPKSLPTKIFHGENYTAGLHMSTSKVTLNFCTINKFSYRIKKYPKHSF
jgi:hypothetical protein